MADPTGGYVVVGTVRSNDDSNSILFSSDIEKNIFYMNMINNGTSWKGDINISRAKSRQHDGELSTVGPYQPQIRIRGKKGRKMIFTFDPHF